LGSGGVLLNEDGEVYRWKPLLDHYSDYVETRINKIILKRKFGDPNGIIAAFVISNTEPNKLILTYDTDTIPAETISPIDAVIDPTVKFPGHGLPTAVAGQRYLLADNLFYGGDDISEFGIAWAVHAHTNDVIEYDGSQWNVVFDSMGNDANDMQIIKSTASGKLFRWIPEEMSWELAIDGDYKPGTWKILFTGSQICS
jgi:hypothetical protein